jgi:hypothetical protein
MSQTCTWACCALLSLALSAVPASAQVTQMIQGTEIFITHQWGNLYTAQALVFIRWDNIVVQDQSGVQTTIDFSNTTTTGNGTYGPIYNYGPYDMEFTWFYAGGVNGFQLGHNHIASTGNPGTCETTHWNALNDNQGVRITRQDGAQFQLVSIDYADCLEAFLIGTSYSPQAYTTLATWSAFDTTHGLVLNSTTYNTLTFQVGPPDVASIKLDQSVPPLVAFSQLTGTFSVSGTVSSYVTTSGVEITSSSPTPDPIIGSTLSILGNYFGTDTNGLTGVVLSPCTTSIIVSPGDSLSVLGQFSTSVGQGDTFALAGPAGALPVRLRSVGNNGPVTPTRSGAGSLVLDGLTTQLATQNMSLLFELTAGTPILRSIEKNYVLPVIPPTWKLGSLNGGGVQFGCIGYTPLSEMFNLVFLSPTYNLGTGPCFGIGFNALTVEQLGMPLGLAPFHVRADAEGNFFWGAPAGSVPLGLTIDMTSVVLGAGGSSAVQIGSPQRVAF